jgi:hypothetical protein
MLAFVEGIRLDAASGSVELTTKNIPEPGPAGTGSAFVLVVGAATKSKRGLRGGIWRWSG